MSDMATIAADSSGRPADRNVFGFWVYLMTDCVLFASLFAVYAVLHNNTFGGPSGSQLFSLPYVLLETLSLLTSSFTCGLAMVATRLRSQKQVLVWLGLTFILGLTFLGLELKEFHHLALIGDSWRRSGFLSAYFALVGTHGAHITVGLIWMAVMMVLVWSGGLSRSSLRRLTLFSLFWHFLDIIWIFIFTIVYLFGAVGV
ncbi:MAG TPA: cytochrome o ubiquinol oxidase subunit III [Candidatus Saccharimonadales bacterium]|nr:cytochrome o ubiquinol oxidase subunit III [Candidatus Saccharimonadales bacterium]